MNLNFLNPLLKRKADLQQRISEAKAACIEAETALRLCDDLERSLPNKIAAIRAEFSVPQVTGAWSAIEDAFVQRDIFCREAEVVEALESLAKDLKAIRAHWEKRRAELAA